MTQRDPKTYAIIGAAMEVHRQSGYGFLEAVYQEALALELKQRQIPSRREVELPIFYKKQRLDTSYRADFICYDSVLGGGRIKSAGQSGRSRGSPNH